MLLSILFSGTKLAEKGSEESAAHSDSHGNRGESRESPPCGSISSSCKLELYLSKMHSDL